MSSFLKLFIPAVGGAAGAITLAYVLADQFIADIPAPLRTTTAVAQSSETSAPPTAEAAAPDMVVEAQSPAASHAGGFGLGRTALEAEIAAWDIDIRPDGAGLPAGSGDVWTGEDVFVEKCAVCHGDFGEAVGRWPQLAGGTGTIDGADPVKTIGSYWPYLSTVYDYIYRAMPFGEAQSLTPDEVYAITAYLLYLNDVVDDDFELSDANFAEVKMPNEDGFFLDDRADTELVAFSGEPCMENCKDSVEITMRARVLDVTPDTAGDDAVEEAEAPADAAPVVETAAAEAAAPAAEPEMAAAAPAAGPDPELVAAGERLFRQCAACHRVGDGASNAVGPQLNGVLGRTIGGVEGFRYSSAFTDAMEAGDVWGPENLAAFLENPRAAMQGTKMVFRGLSAPDDREAMIAYLASLSP